MIYITNAHYIDGHRLQIAFNDNRSGMVDLSEIMRLDHRPIFNELCDIEKFKQFSLDADTIVWENGLDLAPEFLYQQLQ